MSCVIICSKLLANNVNKFSAAIGGILFSVGWWLMIDVQAAYPNLISENKVYHLPGMFATASLIVVNIIPLGVIQDSYYYTEGKCCGSLMAKASLFVGLLIGFGSLIGASYILVNDFLLVSIPYYWPGVGVFFQTVFIFAANMILKFGTRNDEF